MNETPRGARKRVTHADALSPEKPTAHESRSQTFPDIKGHTLQPNILGWDSTDAKPMPDEGLLRDFDLNPKFGPCCTLTRKDRFLRAELLGLSPPADLECLIERTGNNESVLDMHLSQVSTSGSFR
jgi:hypothetical protein